MVDLALRSSTPVVQDFLKKAGGTPTDASFVNPGCSKKKRRLGQRRDGSHTSPRGSARAVAHMVQGIPIL